MGYILIQDNDCHWYLIPEHLKEEFYDWVKYCEGNQESCDYRFENDSIDGPHRVRILEWEMI